jgi:cell division protein FtsW
VTDRSKVVDLRQKSEGSRLSDLLLLSTLLLVSLGIVSVFTSSALKGSQQFADSFLFLRKHAIVSVIGFMTVIGVQFLSSRFWERITLPLFFLTTTLLLLFFIPGIYEEIGGAKRWIALPGIGGQPAELAKLAFVLFLAKHLSRESFDPKNFVSGVLPCCLALLVFLPLILLQRDLGTCFLLVAVAAVMLFIAGIRSRYLLLGFGLGLVGLFLSIVTEPYRVKRIMAFLDPWSQAQSGGFQILQSFLGFQNGGFLGLGLGESKQKLYYLPEAHSDFILAVIAEELGLLGVLTVLSLIAFVVYLGYRIAMLQRRTYKIYLGLSLTTLICLQAIINIGVTMGMLPTKGIPLPFVSSGNSSLLVLLLSAAIVARLGREPANFQHR